MVALQVSAILAGGRIGLCRPYHSRLIPPSACGLGHLCPISTAARASLATKPPAPMTPLVSSQNSGPTEGGPHSRTEPNFKSKMCKVSLLSTTMKPTCLSFRPSIRTRFLHRSWNPRSERCVVPQTFLRSILSLDVSCRRCVHLLVFNVQRASCVGDVHLDTERSVILSQCN